MTDRKILANKRSQSALEYMMTYGWAILIIVIVAAVLYSFGIFSPSSSISATITGFSGLGSVAANCVYNEGLVISLGNSAGYLINVTSINITDTSISATTNAKIGSVISPSSNEIFLIPTACPAVGSRYSISAIVSYTEPGQTFPGPYVSTGTATGSVSNSNSPQQISYSEPLAIDPSSAQDPPSPFQQMINMTSSAPGWSHISSSPFGQNVEFTYPNGTVIPSWLENYTSSRAIWWVKLASYGSQTIFMDFVPISTNLFNTVNTGEAPQLSQTYAEYDDGTNVFLYYQRWGGLSSLPSGWGSNGVSSAYYSDYMDLWATTGGTLGDIYYAYSPSYPIVLESLATWAQPNPGDNNGNFGLYTQSTSATGTSGTAIQVMTGFGGGGTTNLGFISSSSSGSMSYSPPSSASILSIQIASSSEAVFSDEYTNFYTASGQTIDSASYIQYETTYASSSTSDLFSIYWTRTRAYPPNGVMPSVTFGSIQ